MEGLAVIAAIVAVRLVAPLMILKFPFWGILASIAADFLDYPILDLVTGIPASYQQVDKLLDLYFLAVALIVSFRWERLQKVTSVALFGYRLIGFALFELTLNHAYLFYFPNLFEFFFVFEAARRKFFPQFKLTPKRLAVALFLLLLPKLLQEYLIHIRGFDLWAWFKSLFAM